MTIRYWLSGPRILHRLVRPRISFSAADLAGTFTKGPRASDISLLYVISRRDGDVMIGTAKTATERYLEMSAGDKMALVFAFRSLALLTTSLREQPGDSQRSARTRKDGMP